MSAPIPRPIDGSVIADQALRARPPWRPEADTPSSPTSEISAGQESDDVEHLVYGSMLEFSDTECVVVFTDFSSVLLREVLPNDDRGLIALEEFVADFLHQGSRVILVLNILRRSFSPSEQRSLNFRLPHRFCQEYYSTQPLPESDSRVFLYDQRSSILSLLEEDFALVLLDAGAPFALFAYVTGETQAAYAVDVALMSCSIATNPGWIYCFRSQTLPPSSQDIAYFLRDMAELTGLPPGIPLDSSVIGPDIVWTMSLPGQPGMEFDFDREEFHLQFMEDIAKYKPFGTHVAQKMAVIASCARNGVSLKMSSFTAEDEHGAGAESTPHYEIVPLWLPMARVSDEG